MPANRTGALTKGYMENRKTKKVLRFQYNPEEFTDSQGVEYREIKSPGISYPAFQYVGGEVRTVEFTLFLDNMENKKATNKVEETIKFVEQFLPTSNKGSKYTPPPSMLFAFGWFVKECLLVRATPRYTMFDRSLRPLRAELDITLNIVQ